MDGAEHVTPRYMLDTSFYYRPAAVPSPDQVPIDSETESAELARKLLDRTGVRQGWGVVLGAQDGRVALEVVRQSDLKLVIFETDEQKVASTRRLLSDAGVYGVRASVHHVTESELPYGAELANLVFSEQSFHDSKPPRWGMDEVYRLLRPSGGTAIFRTAAPTAAGSDESVWSEWFGDTEVARTTRGGLGGRWAQVVRDRLEGSGDWSHQYGGANNTSSSLDEHVKGELEVSWWGDPGPRPMPDRGPRNPAPLSVNGRLYIQGDRILFGLDAYNGSILWSVIAPEVRRANLPRDCSNATADDDALYVAHNAYCIEFDGQTGVRRKRHVVPFDGDNRNYDWGFVSVVDGHLIGSRVRRDSRYLGDSGEWFEDYHPDQVSRVVSDTLFGQEVDGSGERWEYRGGAILNSTITIGDDMIFFIESRNPEAVNARSGRLHPDILTDTHLVALDMRSGAQLWEAEQDFSKLQFMTYLVYSDNTLVATGTDSSKNYHTYAFTAPPMITPTEAVQPLVFGGKQIWSDSHKEDKGHHSGHLQHPVVVDGVFYSDQRAFDLKTGETLRTDLPERRGCGTMSASRGALFFRHYFHGMWDLESDKRTQFEGIRGGCWLGLIPAGGMLLAPESSAGCSCTHAIQISVGYSPKARTYR
jgi:outer membrane protein assembly factor BamB